MKFNCTKSQLYIDGSNKRIYSFNIIYITINRRKRLKITKIFQFSIAVIFAVILPGFKIIENFPTLILNIQNDNYCFRHYPQVTDRSLHHLAVSKLNLEFVDVTGSAVTQEGVQLFRMQKPEVKIVSSFDDS